MSGSDGAGPQFDAGLPPGPRTCQDNVHELPHEGLLLLRSITGGWLLTHRVTGEQVEFLEVGKAILRLGRQGLPLEALRPSVGELLVKRLHAFLPHSEHVHECIVPHLANVHLAGCGALHVLWHA